MRLSLIVIPNSGCPVLMSVVLITVLPEAYSKRRLFGL